MLAGAGALAALVLAGFFLLPLDGKNKGKDDIKPSVTPTASAATGVPAAYAGTWKGTVTDTNGGSFSLNLTLNAGTETGRFVASGGSNCNQPVNYRSTSGTTLTLRLEESTDPPCSAGTVTVTLNGSTLAYRYQDASVSATATLTK